MEIFSNFPNLFFLELHIMFKGKEVREIYSMHNLYANEKSIFSANNFIRYSLHVDWTSRYVHKKCFEFILSTGAYFDLTNISPCIHKASSELIEIPVIIDREAGEIIRLVASVRPSVSIQDT